MLSDEDLMEILPKISKKQEETPSLKMFGAGHAGKRINDKRYSLYSHINHF